MKTDHLLVIRFSAMGDVAMTVPVVYALAAQYPQLRITVLSRPFARPFFERLAPNVGFMGADIKGEYKGMKGLNALYRRLVAKQFTAVADLHSVLRSDYLRMRFHLDRYRVAHIDKHRKGKRQLVQRYGKQLVQQPTSFDNYADVFARLGYPIKLYPALTGKGEGQCAEKDGQSVRTDVSVAHSIFGDGKGDLPDVSVAHSIFRDGKGDLPDVSGFHSIFGDGRGDLSLLPAEMRQYLSAALPAIGIAPFAAHEGKIYPIEHMEKVVLLLLTAHPESRIFLFGNGEKEMAVINLWAASYTQVVNASAMLHGLYEELVLMSHLQLMVTMDSANMHFASLVGTPVVSIWGATHPYAGFMGWRQKSHNAVQLDLPCRPCSIYGNKPCMRKDFACMQGIEPQMVAHRIEIALKERSL